MLYNEDTEEFFYDDGRDVKEETRVEVQRDSFQDDSNDILIVNVGENVIAEYDGVQIEKNYQSTDENDRHAPDLSDPAYPNVTLPESDDYKLTLLADSESSYENALAVTSKTVQILGLDTVGVEEKYKFLIHSMSKKKKKYIRAMSYGCQILGDTDHKKFSAVLSDLGFNVGASLNMSNKNGAPTPTLLPDLTPTEAPFPMEIPRFGPGH